MADESNGVKAAVAYHEQEIQGMRKRTHDMTEKLMVLEAEVGKLSVQLDSVRAAVVEATKELGKDIGGLAKSLDDLRTEKRQDIHEIYKEIGEREVRMANRQWRVAGFVVSVAMVAVAVAGVVAALVGA